ncbi:MAG: nucleotide pyrophosphohydrolase [Candidatus Nanohaloarchaea archaeon]|nr:nucleotide pyrophosphohydrolase [Candidatus Nanohaloarchaea archaeon]
MTDSDVTLDELKDEIGEFCGERDWDQFHDAKELAVALSIEASELLEHFRYMDEDQVAATMDDPDQREDVKDELADVFYHLLRIAQFYDIDLADAFHRKLAKTAEKYPVEKAKGSRKKYTEFDD